MKIAFISFSAAALMMAGAATAQEAPAPQAAPPAAAQGQATIEVSDGEVDQFAQAVLAVQKIADDQTIEQSKKQPAMAAAVQQSGLAPQRFNEIAQASQGDAALQQRIQLAANKYAQPAGPSRQ